MNDGRSLEAAEGWAYSSVVEHCVDIAGVASSNLATPTIFFSALQSTWRDAVPALVRARESAEVAIPQQQRNFSV